MRDIRLFLMRASGDVSRSYEALSGVILILWGMVHLMPNGLDAATWMVQRMLIGVPAFVIASAVIAVGMGAIYVAYRGSRRQRIWSGILSAFVILWQSLTYALHGHHYLVFWFLFGLGLVVVVVRLIQQEWPVGTPE